MTKRPAREMKRRNWRCLLFSSWDVLLITANMAVSSSRSRFSLIWQGCRVGKDFRTSGACSFKAKTLGSISIGDGVTFLAYWRSNRVGLNGRVILHTIGEGTISIGDSSGGSSVVISSRKRITIGKNCKIGGNVRIFDHDFHSLDFLERRSSEDQKNVRCKPVTIGDDVFIGTNAIVLKGVSIGNRSVVGAGVVVTHDIPEDCIVSFGPQNIRKKGTTQTKNLP